MRAACLPFLIIVLISAPSESSAQWIRATRPAPGRVIALIFKGETLVAGTGAGLFRYTRTGSAWNVVDSVLLLTDLTRVIDGMTGIIAGTSGHGVFLSSDTGKTWTPSDTGLTDATIYSLAACGTEVFASARSGGFLSTDNGSHWTGMPPWDGRYAPYGILTPVAYAPQYPETGVRALLGGTQSNGVFLSTDDGRSWTAVNNGFPPPVPFYEIGYPGIFSLAFAGTSLIAGTDEGVYFSTDFGGHWTASDSGWVLGGALCFASRDSDVFAGSVKGVFHSSDGGRTWREANSGLPGTGITALAIFGSDLYAGVFEDGIWRRPLSEMVTSVNKSLSGAAGAFELAQNYPNPFNPSTTIRYVLPRRSHATLTVFSTLGQQVATLVNALQDAGNHDVLFDGSRMASGVYFYRLDADGYVATKRLVIVR